MEESGPAASRLLLPAPFDRTLGAGGPLALPERPPPLPPRLCLDPPLPGPQGHTGGRKPKEGREGVRRAAHAAPGRSSFLLAPIYVIGCGLPAPTSWSARGQWAGSTAGEDKESCTLRHLWSTSAPKRHDSARAGEGQRYLFHLPRLLGPLPSPGIKGCSVLLSKQVHSRALGSQGGRCQDAPWAVGARQLTELGAQGVRV